MSMTKKDFFSSPNKVNITVAIKTKECVRKKKKKDFGFDGFFEILQCTFSKQYGILVLIFKPNSDCSCVGHIKVNCFNHN